LTVTLAFLGAFVGMLLLATPWAYADAPLRSPHLLGVFDAKGRLVGNVLGVATPVNPVQSVVIAYRVGDNIFIALQVFRDHFEGTTRTLLFESPDCSGTPFVITADQAQALMPVTVVAVPGSTVYRADRKAIPRTITVGSEMQADGTCTVPGGPDDGPVIQPDAVPAIPFVDLSQVFTPPFTVR
jgi:hypothetical protein